MGNYRIVVNAIGGHGCQREVKDGGKVMGCKFQTCPDCITQEYVAKLAACQNVVSAELIHWPGETSEVRDEFVLPKVSVGTYVGSTGVTQSYVQTDPIHRIRHGNF